MSCINPPGVEYFATSSSCFGTSELKCDHTAARISGVSEGRVLILQVPGAGGEPSVERVPSVPGTLRG